jgi:hypothetical protein
VIPQGDPADPNTFLELMKARKLDVVRTAGVSGHFDLPFTIDCYRRGTHVALLIFGQPRSDLTELGADIAITGYAADRVVASYESYTTSTVINPTTGQEWGPNEMGELFDAGTHPDVVFEALHVISVPREGAATAANARYVRKRHRLTWLPPSGELTDVGGQIFEGLRQSLDRPTVNTVMHEQHPDVWAAEQFPETRTDILTTKLLLSSIPDIGVLLSAQDPVSHELIDQAFMDRTLADFRRGWLLAAEHRGADGGRLARDLALLTGAGLDIEWDVLAGDDL